MNNETCDYSVSNNFLFTKMQYVTLYKFNNVICYMFSFQCNKMKCDPNELAKDWKQYSPAFTNICFSILTKLIIYCSLCHNILRKNRSKKLNHWPSRDSHAVFHHIARYVFQFQNFDWIWIEIKRISLDNRYSIQQFANITIQFHFDQN